jgi:hypothetical protein
MIELRGREPCDNPTQNCNGRDHRADEQELRPDSTLKPALEKELDAVMGTKYRHDDITRLSEDVEKYICPGALGIFSIAKYPT